MVVEQGGEARPVEEHPGVEDEREKEDAGERAGETESKPTGEELVCEEGDAVCAAPEDEVPGGTVPETGKEEHDEEIEGPEPGSRTAEREVDIVSEPVRERAVPATPKVRDIDGGIRGGEVLCKPDAHATREAVGGQAVAAEIEVDAEPEGEVAEPKREDVAAGVGGVAEREVVAEAELEEESEDDVAEAPGDIRGAPAEAERAHLGKKPRPALDRPRNDLRDERFKAEEVDEGGEVRAVARGIDEESDGLEGVERDADGEDERDRIREIDAEVGRNE